MFLFDLVIVVVYSGFEREERKEGRKSTVERKEGRKLRVERKEGR